MNEQAYDGLSAKKALLALVPTEKRDYASALIEDIITYRFVAAKRPGRSLGK